MSFTISGAMLGMCAGIYMISSFGDCSHHRNKEYVVDTDSITDGILCVILFCVVREGEQKMMFTSSLWVGRGGGKYSWEERIFIPWGNKYSGEQNIL